MEPTSIDKHGLMRRMANSDELLRQFVELLFAQYEKEVDKLEQAFVSEDLHTIHRGAHSVKGLFQNFFVGALVAKIFAVEAAAREGDLDLARQNMELFREELKASAPLFEELKTLYLDGEG